MWKYLVLSNFKKNFEGTPPLTGREKKFIKNLLALGWEKFANGSVLVVRLVKMFMYIYAKIWKVLEKTKWFVLKLFVYSKV